jgi:hypothetical protein
MWKKEGDIKAKMENKLSLLCQTGKMIWVEVYMRNQNIIDDSYKELYQ